MKVARCSYCCESLVHFRPSLLHSRLLNKAAGQLTVVLRNPGCSLFHHLPLLRGWCLWKRTLQVKMRPHKAHVCVCVVGWIGICAMMGWIHILTLRAAAKLFFRLVAMLMSRGSRHVIMAIPAVRFLIMWWAARRMRDSSESSAKSFLMICSQVVMAILIERSTTGCTSSWTARSTDCRTHCFN